MPCKLLPCGHCESALTDDDCGKPEHRFCALCHAGECNEGLAEALEIMVKEKKALELQLQEARKVILTLSSSLNHLAPEDGPARRVAGKDIEMARSFLAGTTEKRQEGS